MNTNEALKFHRSLIDHISEANAKIDAVKYGHRHPYAIGDRVARNGEVHRVLWVGLDTLGLLSETGHASLAFPSEVAGPLPEAPRFLQHVPALTRGFGFGERNRKLTGVR